MNKRLLIPIVLLAFSLGLGATIGLQLSGAAALVALGAAVGVIVGIPVGLLTALLAVRWGLFPQKQTYATWEDMEQGVLMLTPEQADALVNLLQRPQISASGGGGGGGGGFARSAPSDRDFTVVGGANLGRGEE